MLKVTDIRPPADAARAVRALIAATFVIAAAFGLNVPLLPPLILAVSPDAGAARVPLHAGLLAAVFTFALGAAAPAWGAWSDRVGRRPVLLIGMGAFGATMLLSAAPAGLTALYAEQLFSGLAAAAVMPVASALVADLAPDDHWRASRLAWLNMALVAGFILGPIVGSLSDRLLMAGVLDGRVLVTPFLAVAALAAVVVGILWRAVPRRLRVGGPQVQDRRSRMVTPLLALTFVVSLTIGIFEVAIAIRGGRGLGLTPAQVGTLFTSCSLVMFAAQAVVFAPKVAPASTARLLAPSFLALAAGLAGAGVAGSFGYYLAAVTLFAASGGVLVPVLAYWVSRHAGGAQGGQLGRQTAAAGLGQAAGSAVAGLLFDSPTLQGLALWVGAAVALAAAAASARLAGRLSGPGL